MSIETSRPPREPLVLPGQIDHHVNDMTVTAAADLSLEALQQHLGRNEQWLPIDGNPQSSLQELIQTNSSGPLRLGFGAWRDLLLGAQFTTPSGKFITAGGRTMKNVAGYDLTKFLVGSFGLFGTTQTITTRAYRRPTHGLLVRFESSVKRVNELLPTSARPQWTMLASGALWCGYLGDEKSVAFYETELASRRPVEMRRQTLAEDIAFRSQHWLPDRVDIRFRASVPPSRLETFLSRIVIPDASADPTFGIVVGSCSTDRKTHLRQSAKDLGGSVNFDDPDDRQKLFGVSGIQLDVLKRIESAFEQ